MNNIYIFLFDFEPQFWGKTREQQVQHRAIENEV